MEEDIEVIDPANDTEQENPETPENESAEDKVARIEASNKKLFERTKKAEAELKALKTKNPSSKAPKKADIDDDLANDVKELKTIEKKRQFGYRNSLSPEETDNLFRFAGDEDPSEALKNPFFQSALSASRAKTRVEDATPSGSNRSTKVDGKTFKDMSDEERGKNWGKIVTKK